MFSISFESFESLFRVFFEENHVEVTLHVTYTDVYPDEAPMWKLEDVKGLSDEKLQMLQEKIEALHLSMLANYSTEVYIYS